MPKIKRENGDHLILSAHVKGDYLIKCKSDKSAKIISKTIKKFVIGRGIR